MFFTWTANLRAAALTKCQFLSYECKNHTSCTPNTTSLCNGIIRLHSATLCFWLPTVCVYVRVYVCVVLHSHFFIIRNICKVSCSQLLEQKKKLCSSDPSNTNSQTCLNLVLFYYYLSVQMNSGQVSSEHSNALFSCFCLLLFPHL